MALGISPMRVDQEVHMIVSAISYNYGWNELCSKSTWVVALPLGIQLKIFHNVPYNIQMSFETCQMQCR